jgi:hypothetical protein
MYFICLSLYWLPAAQPAHWVVHPLVVRQRWKSTTEPGFISISLAAPKRNDAPARAEPGQAPSNTKQGASEAALACDTDPHGRWLGRSSRLSLMYMSLNRPQYLLFLDYSVYRFSFRPFTSQVAEVSDLALWFLVFGGCKMANQPAPVTPLSTPPRCPVRPTSKTPIASIGSR